MSSTRDSSRSAERKKDGSRRTAAKSRRDTEALIDKLVERHRETLDYLKNK